MISHRSVLRSADNLVYFSGGNGGHGCRAGRPSACGVLALIIHHNIIILIGPALTFAFELADETVTVLSILTR